MLPIKGCLIFIKLEQSHVFGSYWARVVLMKHDVARDMVSFLNYF